MTKIGAMFGLDARIALAIFGALSVISGAALYSSIAKTKAVALLTGMQEARKSWEHYYLDTGSQVDKVFVTASYIDNENLVVNKGVAGWNGPYTSLEVSSLDSTRLAYPPYSELLFNLVRDTTWNGNWVSFSCTGTGSDCYSWVFITGLPDVSIAKDVDVMVDGTVDQNNGSLRWYYHSAKDTYTIALKNMLY